MNLNLDLNFKKHLNLFSHGAAGNSIRLDICSMCQLKCPLCSTGKSNNKNSIIGWGFLRFDNFKKIIERNRWIRNIELSNWGEIFLNPELKEIIRYAFENDIVLSAGNGVNLNYLNEEMAECMVKYRINNLSVSIDGISPEVYGIYRKGGHFSRVIENIKLINFYKNKYKSALPKLTWQFVIFGHNEHELEQAVNMAKELNMTFKPKLNWDENYSPVKDSKKVKETAKIPAATRKEYNSITGKEYKQPCLQLWNSPQINWDGKLLGCCVNRFTDFGNVLEDGLIPLLKSEKYTYAKKMLLGKKEFRNDLPCAKCDRFTRL